MAQNSEPTSSNDFIVGTLEADKFSTLEGNDTVFGLAGNDGLSFLFQSPLGDTLSVAVRGLFGNEGNDRLLGGEGDDVLNGNEGNDLVLGSGGDDVLSLSSRDDTGEGDDTLVGGDVDEFLFENFGDDTLLGSGGYDVLIGVLGDNALFGGNGDDFVSGSFGARLDTLTGGQGSDIFRLAAIDAFGNGQVFYAANGNEDYALIKDFNPSPNQDSIQLSSPDLLERPEQDYYSLRPSPEGLPSGTRIFSGDDLISVLEGVSLEEVSLDSDNFDFLSV